VVTSKKHPCSDGVDFIKARSQAQAFPADWEIVVLCNRSEYETAEKDWRIRGNLGAFTVLTAKRTYLLFANTKLSRVKDFDFLLGHELEHIRCMCDLGEGKGQK
jgi:hypothetical protein